MVWPQAATRSRTTSNRRRDARLPNHPPQCDVPVIVKTGGGWLD